jgi:ADP-ribose pyrophosphatase
MLRVYLAEELSPGQVGPDPDEHLEVVRLPLDEALEWIAAGRIVDAKTIVGLFRTRDRLSADGRGSAGGG